MTKSTSIVLGDHLTDFIDQQVSTGRFGSASEVIRAGLRILEEHEAKQRALQQAITAGLNSGVVENFNMEAIQQELDNG